MGNRLKRTQVRSATKHRFITPYNPIRRARRQIRYVPRKSRVYRASVWRGIQLNRAPVFQQLSYHSATWMTLDARSRASDALRASKVCLNRNSFMIVSLGPRTPVNFIYIGLSIGFKLVLLNSSNAVGKFAVIQNAFPIFISERKNQRTLHFFYMRWTCDQMWEQREN